MKDGTQYGCRMFQCPPELVQGVCVLVCRFLTQITCFKNGCKIIRLTKYHSDFAMMLRAYWGTLTPLVVGPDCRVS